MAAFLLSLALLARSPNYNDCISHNGQHATGHYDAKNNPEIDPAIANPTTINLFFHCGGYFATENGDGITAVSTALLFAITLMLAYLGYEQGRTSRAELRGYIFGEMGPVEIQVGKIPWMDVRIKNYGTTPVRKLALTGMVVVLDLPMDIARMSLPKEEPPDFTLAPGEFHTSRIEGVKTISESDIAAIKDGKRGLFYIGLIIYRDAFGERRETRFSWVWYGVTRDDGHRKLTHALRGNSWT